MSQKLLLIPGVLLIGLLSATGLILTVKGDAASPAVINKPAVENTIKEKVSTSAKKSTRYGTVAIYGDSRDGTSIHMRIVKQIMKSRPVAVFHTGDMVHHGNSKSEWATFNKITRTLRKKADFYPALGNHEGNSPLYYRNFKLPNNERWYSVNEAGIHFIVLDTNARVNANSTQYKWLQRDLKKNVKKRKFIVAVFHDPPFSTGKYHEDPKGLQYNIVPLLEKYRVALVLNGHQHNYERLKHNNAYYVITGGGGASLYRQVIRSPYSQKYIKKYNYSLLRRTGNQLTLEAFDISGNLLDKLVINR